MSDAVLLQVSGLRKAFGGLVAVNDLSFSVGRGEIVGLLGPNGSGKTTAMNLISGAAEADSGSVLFKGRSISAEKPHRIARLGIARTFQLVRVLPSLNCCLNVEAGFAFRPRGLFGNAARSEAIALLRRVGLGGKESVAAGELTYIDSKRLELARAMALAPELLLLDEWLAGLNPTELVEGIGLLKQLQAAGITMLMVEHVMEAVRSLCTRCVVMSAGIKLVEAPTAEALADERVVRAYLGGDEAGESAHA